MLKQHYYYYYYCECKVDLAYISACHSFMFGCTFVRTITNANEMTRQKTTYLLLCVRACVCVRVMYVCNRLLN